MNTTKNMILAVSMAVCLQACQQTATNKTEGTTTLEADTTLSSDSAGKLRTDTAKLHDGESGFIEQAALGGMMEVELGNLTTQKTKNPKVMAFAKRMIADHIKTGARLQEIAKGMGIKLPTQLPTAEQGHLAAMRQMQSKEYDENYMDMMVQDHGKTIDLFNGATRFKNPQLRDFATKTLPVLEAHNKMAIGIDSLYKTKKPDNNGDDLPNVDKNRKN